MVHRYLKSLLSWPSLDPVRHFIDKFALSLGDSNYIVYILSVNTRVYIGGYLYQLIYPFLYKGKSVLDTNII